MEKKKNVNSTWTWFKGKGRLSSVICQKSAAFMFSLWSVISKVTQSCPALCNPTDCSTPGFPDQHQLPELAQIHVHQVGDAIQPSHPLSSPSPPAFSLSQHQGLFQWLSSLHQVARVLEFQLQHQSFQWTFKLISFRINGLISSQSKGLSRVFSKATVQIRQFFGAQLSL